MKCIACGREMLDRGTHYECSNNLCDYVEEIESRDVWARPERDLPDIMLNNSTRSYSLNY